MPEKTGGMEGQEGERKRKSRPIVQIQTHWAFSPPLGNASHNPFFSMENAPSWITSFGYQLFLEHDETVVHPIAWDPEDASMDQLRAYRKYMLGDEYLEHPFFSLEDTDIWISPVVFQAYMALIHSSADEYRGRDPTPFSSCAPSRTASSVSRGESKSGSHMSLFEEHCGRDRKPFSSHAPSRAASSISHDAPRASSRMSFVPSSRAIDQAQRDPSKIKITRQLKVDAIIDTTVQSKWTVPHIPTAYRVDFSNSKAQLTTTAGKLLSLEAYIRIEDQESWRGSTGHVTGDVLVRGFTPDLSQEIHARRCQFYCNGVDTCEFIDPDLFSGCSRYVPDEGEMQELWNHELEANELEAASAPRTMSRFYTRIMKSKCKIECNGIPIMVLRSKGPSPHGKKFFIGCSKWSRNERYDHLSRPMSANINEDVLRFVMEHNGTLPDSTTKVNEKCVLTVHPRVGLKNCPYSHIPNGQIKPAKIRRRACPTEMLIFIPVDSDAVNTALVVLINAHNHPAHPKAKPSTEDKLKLGRAVEAAGLTGLTVNKLLNAASTSLVYNGERVSESSPAFTARRKVRDFIVEKKKEHPGGMGWDGVMYQLSAREVKLLKAECYIHTGMSKNGFRLVVTMHPQIGMFIHKLLSLNIDYTFKRVKGAMDEWEVVGFLDRFKHRLTFASLFCDKKSDEAFAQLFAELFDTIKQVTGEALKLQPFFPGANCPTVMLDGDVAQAQGFGEFLVSYNDPEISGIHSRDRLELSPLGGSHVDELPSHIPQSVITRLKSIMGQDDIDEWHDFCRDQLDPAVKNWYAHKLANPWVLPPNHSNYVETAHAGRNAETATGVEILTAILQLHSFGLCFHCSKDPKPLNNYDTLKLERDNGTEENKTSLARQRELESEIKSLQEQLKIDKRRTDLKERISGLRSDTTDEQTLRREWVIHRAAIDMELETLRKGPLVVLVSTGDALEHGHQDRKRPLVRPLPPMVLWVWMKFKRQSTAHLKIKTLSTLHYLLYQLQSTCIGRTWLSSEGDPQTDSTYDDAMPQMDLGRTNVSAGVDEDDGGPQTKSTYNDTIPPMDVDRMLPAMFQPGMVEGTLATSFHIPHINLFPNSAPIDENGGFDVGSNIRVSVDPNFDVDSFLENFDPFTLDYPTFLAVGTADANPTMDTYELEYFGEPAGIYDSGPGPLQQVVANERDDSSFVSSDVEEQSSVLVDSRLGRKSKEWCSRVKQKVDGGVPGKSSSCRTKIEYGLMRSGSHKTFRAEGGIPQGFPHIQPAPHSVTTGHGLMAVDVRLLPSPITQSLWRWERQQSGNRERLAYRVQDAMWLEVRDPAGFYGQEGSLPGY
ncbi:hypothetical protein C8R44DRAFT_749669 [Mycena epipterygia]|nr:hypothetical protein C8R44DRAFT_749669 [Mycena epipterygia]